MSLDHHARGGAPVAVLNRLDAWEANLVLNLRLWCQGPSGQQQVWNDYATTFGGGVAQDEMRAFEELVLRILDNSSRPLVRHDVACSCVGSDECIFLNLVRTASEGHLADASLIATLLASPAHAEPIAILAGRVGEAARKIQLIAVRKDAQRHSNVVRLH